MRGGCGCRANAQAFAPGVLSAHPVDVTFGDAQGGCQPEHQCGIGLTLDGAGMQAHFQRAIKQAFAVGACRMGHHMDIDVAIPIGLPMQERPCGRELMGHGCGKNKKPDA